MSHAVSHEGQDGMSEPPPTPPTKCPHCKKSFPKEQAMYDHMAKEAKRSSWQFHIHCKICKKPFPTWQALRYHSATNHAQDQDLNCPACNRHFVRCTDLVRHYEQNQCVINTNKLAEVREQKLRFSRELQARHFGDYDEAVEGPLMSRNAALRPKPEATVRPYPVQFDPYETDTTDLYALYSNMNQTVPRVPDAKRIMDSPSKDQLPGPEPTTPDSNKDRDIHGLDPHGSPPKDEWSSPEHSTGCSDKSGRGVFSPTQTGPTRTGVSLLEDFVPTEHPNLQIALIDYADAGGRGPWSVDFNPWVNDDLAGMSSRASSRAPSPDDSDASTLRGNSHTATIHVSSSGATLRAGPPAASGGSTTITNAGRFEGTTETSKAAPPAKKPAPSLASNQASSMKSSRPSTPSYSSHATMPLGRSEYLTSNTASIAPIQNTSAAFPAQPSQALTPTKTTSGSAIAYTQNNSAAMPAPTSQALTPVKPSGAVMPIHNTSATMAPNTSTALTPTKGSRAVGPAQSTYHEQMGPMGDFDQVKASVARLAAFHNPRNPNFSVQKYWNHVIGKYKCPMPQCFTSFKKPGQFTHHLGTHMQEKKYKYPCPGCKDMFDSLSALIAHTESQSTRCHFRHSKNYGHFLSQALAGIVDVVSENMEHSTVQFAISKDAKQMLGVAATDNDARAGRSLEFKAATAALDERAIDWEEHERMIEAQKAKERENDRAKEVNLDRAKKIKEDEVRRETEQRAKQEEERTLAELQARQAESQRLLYQTYLAECEAEQKRARQAKTEHSRKSSNDSKAQSEQDRMFEVLKARQLERERAYCTNPDYFGYRQAEVSARQAEQERQAEQDRETEGNRLAEQRRAQALAAQKLEEQKAREAQWAAMSEEDRRILREARRNKGGWNQAKQDPIDNMEEELDDEERVLKVKMAQLKEQRRKIQLEKAKRALEENKRLSQELQSPEEKTATAADTEKEKWGWNDRPSQQLQSQNGTTSPVYEEW